MTGDAKAYDIAAIRELLLRVFTAKELSRFCQDRSLFRPILNEFSTSDGLAHMVDEVITYCQTRDLWFEFLSGAAGEYPRPYRKWYYSLPVSDRDVYPAPPLADQTEQRPARLWTVVILAAAALALVMIVIFIVVQSCDGPDTPIPTSTLAPTLTPTPTPTPTPVACDQERATFDFESSTDEGWEIRWEGSDLLGELLMPDDGHACGSGQWSLAFHFDLRTKPPLNKAQVKYETENLRLDEELSAWVYVPSNAPGDLQASCFILEDNRSAQWPNKPEWPWYQTGYTALRRGEWTLVRCQASDFVANYAGGHYEAPFLLGFEFTRTGEGIYEGVVYLDKVVLR